MYKIEKDVPLPKKGSGRPRKYPFKDMEVGDSFFAKNDKGVTPILNRIQYLASIYGRRYKYRFATRKVNNGVRCWRTK